MSESLFRPEALRHLRVEPWQPPLLARRVPGPLIGVLALVAVALLGLFSTSFEFARKELATGYLAPASGWTRVTASATGVVTHRTVEPGDHVGHGDPLLQFGAGDGIGPERTVERSILDEIAEREQTLEEHLNALEAQFAADVALHREQTRLE